MALTELIQASSDVNLSEAMVEAFGSLFTFADSVYLITQKVAFLILVAALIVHGWRGKTAQDVTIWLWVLLSLLFASIAIGQWLDITRPPDGSAWELGQAIANKVDEANPQSSVSTSMATFFSEVIDGFPNTHWYDLVENFKQGLILLCIVLSKIVVFFMRIIQMAMIAILYSLGPIFVSFICIGLFRNAGIRYLFTLGSMYTWDLAWKFVDAGTAALLSFGGVPTGEGYFNPALLPLTLIWAIGAPIIMPVFLSRLFISGASGAGEAASGFAMGRMSSAGGAIGKMSLGQLGQQIKSGAGSLAAVGTGVGAVAAVASNAFSGMKNMMAKASVSSGAGSGASTSSTRSSSSSGPLQAGESISMGGTSIKRSSADSFSIGKQNFSGDPNNPSALYAALMKTQLSPVTQATIRNDMRDLQTT